MKESWFNKIENKFIDDTIDSKFTGFVPLNHLNAINMEENKIDSWYVRVTEENKEQCDKWRGFNIKVGHIIGITKSGNKGHNPEPHDVININKIYFDREITTEEFYRKIGLIKELNYEIC